jgi:hypothetical protein
VSAPDAIVIEKFPPERSTFKYLLLRWFETGVSDVMIAERYKFSKVKRTLKELFLIPARIVAIPFLALTGLKRPCYTILLVVASVGWLCGLLGKSARYYSRST